MRWHYVVTNEMREAGLSGSDLIVYAVIHGYSANGQGCFYGTLEYLSELVGLKPRAVRNTLRDLENRGYIHSDARPGSATRYCVVERHEVLENAARQKMPPPPAKNAAPLYKDEQECEHELKHDNTQISVANFRKPSVEEVAAYCRERGNNIDPAAFVSRYEANGWKVGKAPMKDWRAAVRYWETQERPAGSPTPKAPSRQQSAYEKMAAMLQDNHAALATLADEEGGEL